MKTLKILTRALKVLGIILIGIFLFIVSLLFLFEPVDRALYGEGEYSYNSYPTYAAAAAANAIGGDSVIPQFLPPSATEIRYETYNDLDTSILWLSFNFDPEEMPHIRKRCDRLAKAWVGYWGGRPSGDFIHWPEEITGTVSSEKIPGYEFYRCEDDTRAESFLGIRTGGLLSVDIKGGRAYYIDN